MTAAVLWLTLAATDVFSPAFADTVQQRASAACASNAAAFVLDTTPWNRAWVAATRSTAKAEDEGKQNYVQFLKDRYFYSIERVNEVYRLESGSFTDLLINDFKSTDAARPEVRRDDDAFLLLMAEQVERVLKSSWKCPGRQARAEFGPPGIVIRLSPKNAQVQ